MTVCNTSTALVSLTESEGVKIRTGGESCRTHLLHMLQRVVRKMKRRRTMKKPTSPDDRKLDPVTSAPTEAMVAPAEPPETTQTHLDSAASPSPCSVEESVCVISPETSTCSGF